MNKERILFSIHFFLTLVLVILSIYYLAYHPDYRHWHDADNISLLMPDDTVIEGPGKWKANTTMVTVEIHGQEYNTSWDNVVATGS